MDFERSDQLFKEYLTNVSTDYLLDFIQVYELALLIAEYTFFKWECDECYFETNDDDEMLNHCCCLSEQRNCQERLHHMTYDHCAAYCHDCGCGGCGCSSYHCCCPEEPPNCPGGLVHFLSQTS